MTAAARIIAIADDRANALLGLNVVAPALARAQLYLRARQAVSVKAKPVRLMPARSRHQRGFVVRRQGEAAQ